MVAMCVTEAFSSTCAVHIEDCEGWWLADQASLACVLAYLHPSFHILGIIAHMSMFANNALLYRG